MKRLLKEIIQTVVIIAALNFPAAAEVSKKASVFLLNDHVGSIDGELNDKTVQDVEQLWKEKKFKILTITSPGGDFDAGIKMGNFVRDNGINLIVSRYCNSACTVVFFSVPPEKRYMTNQSVLGLHNISIKSNVRDRDNTFVSVRQLSTFTEEMATKVGFLFTLYSANGIPPSVLYRVSRARGEDVVILTKKDLIHYGSVNP
ncbi:hypothetical protein UES1_423 [Escherichia phage UE-S1]|nr:hypothetical protein UES1_423 [Escherichia phage UE-S1]